MCGPVVRRVGVGTRWGGKQRHEKYKNQGEREKIGMIRQRTQNEKRHVESKRRERREREGERARGRFISVKHTLSRTNLSGTSLPDWKQRRASSCAESGGGGGAREGV